MVRSTADYSLLHFLDRCKAMRFDQSEGSGFVARPDREQPRSSRKDQFSVCCFDKGFQFVSTCLSPGFLSGVVIAGRLLCAHRTRSAFRRYAITQVWIGLGYKLSFNRK